jgi:hypothetical protein
MAMDVEYTMKWKCVNVLLPPILLIFLRESVEEWRQTLRQFQRDGDYYVVNVSGTKYFLCSVFWNAKELHEEDSAVIDVDSPAKKKKKTTRNTAMPKKATKPKNIINH